MVHQQQQEEMQIAVPVEATLADVVSTPIYGDDVDDFELPSIQLPTEHDDTSEHDTSDSDSSSDIPYATVTTVMDNEEETTSESSSSSSSSPEPTVAQQVLPGYDPATAPMSITEYYETARAEYISACFQRTKKDAQKPLGIKVSFSKERTILEILPNSPAANSPLKVGDKLLSVNQRSCADMTNNELFTALAAIGTLTLIVHNEGGASDIVESMITKSSADEKIGAGVKADIGLGVLLIGSIKEEQLAASNSLLNPQDQILTINSKSARKMTHLEARTVIGQAPKTVTIRAITALTTGVVVSAEEQDLPQPEAEEEEPKMMVMEPARIAPPATGWCNFNFWNMAPADNVAAALEAQQQQARPQVQVQVQQPQPQVQQSQQAQKQLKQKQPPSPRWMEPNRASRAQAA